MAKDLHAVIRLRQWDVDEKRRAMGALLRREQEIVEQQHALEAELKREGEAARKTEDAGFIFGAYYQRYQMRRDQLAQALTTLQGLIEKAQDELADAFRELKTFEISQENRDKREAEAENRKDQVALDEIAMPLHRRRKQGLD